METKDLDVKLNYGTAEEITSKCLLLLLYAEECVAVNYTKSLKQIFWGILLYVLNVIKVIIQMLAVKEWRNMSLYIIFMSF